MRKVWFITRPERDPKFHIDALRALKIATEDFSVIWKRNREVHKKYEAVLASEGLKRDNISNDGSGGRTWCAMLRTFGYVYLNQEGYLVVTKVGQKILNSVKVRENISKQILTLQIPNAYFLDSGFRPKFDTDFQIRPARFLIQLVSQPSLDYYLTKEEITFFALTAKRDDELYKVTQKIIEYRNSTEEKKIKMKENLAINYEHRERADSIARDFAAAHGDVAHTFMMLCDYTGLVDYVRGDALRLPSDRKETTSVALDYLNDRYPFNKRYLFSLERFAENAGLDIDSYKASSFGSLPPATNKDKSVKKVKRLLSSYPSIQSLGISTITDILEKELSKKEATKFAHELHKDNYESLNEEFVESYLFEENDRVFEDKTGEILKSLGFDVVMRPKAIGHDIRTEIEILIHVDDKNVCILDAKNYRQKFTLSAQLASHMASEYIPNYTGFDGKSVAYYGYITANRFSGERQLEKISKKANMINSNIKVSGAILSAKAILGFLDYCIENELTIEERKKQFISLFTNKGYNSITEMH